MGQTKNRQLTSYLSLGSNLGGFERNVSDEMIKLISKNKGVILVNFGSSFVNINSNILFNEINLEVEKWRLENKYKISR